jgi:hypothetical protein
MNGRKLYVMPETTAIGVARTRNPESTSPISLRGPRTIPSSPRMIFQLNVRRRKLVKNGAITRNSSSAL